jgi:hypothetical protein
VRLFPHRSPRQASTNAAVGGLEPPPAGRLRRAYLHLPCSTASRSFTYISSPPRSGRNEPHSERVCGTTAPLRCVGRTISATDAGSRFFTDCKCTGMFSPVDRCWTRFGDALVAKVALRPVDDSDLDALFEQMRDPKKSGPRLRPPSAPSRSTDSSSAASAASSSLFAGGAGGRGRRPRRRRSAAVFIHLLSAEGEAEVAGRFPGEAVRR